MPTHKKTRIRTAKREVCVVLIWHVKEDKLGFELCSRLQLPLILAYGLTVHCAQGMSIAMHFQNQECI